MITRFIRFQLLVFVAVIQVVQSSQSPVVRPDGGFVVDNIRRASKNIQSKIGHWCDEFQIRASDARESFEKAMDDRRERESKENEELLERNKVWRETAEQTGSTATPEQQPIYNAALPRKVSYRDSPFLLFSSTSLSPYTTSLGTVSVKKALDSGLVVSILFREMRKGFKSLLDGVMVQFKIGIAAFLLTEILDRTGILADIVKERIVDFWQHDVLRAYAKFHSNLEGWWFRQYRRLQLEIQMWEAGLLKFGDGAFGLFSRSRSDPSVWSTIKVTFAISTACGMIATPLLAFWMGRLWRPLLFVTAIAETNYLFTTNGRRFVEFLGDNPQTLGATLNTVLERCRRLIRKAVSAMVGSERANWYYEGYGSGIIPGGAVDDRKSDATVMGLLGGVRSRKQDERTRWNYSNSYSLGISASHDHSKEIDIEVYNRKRRAISRLGFIVGCAIGLVVKGK